MIKGLALTIAGSDSGAGAGIQADLKTFAAFGVYGTTVITAVTAQNTCGVHGFICLPASFVEKQIDAVLTDIGAHAVKTGMVANREIINIIAEKMAQYNVEKLVVDPVMMAASGDPLLAKDAQESLVQELFPLALVVTPNIPEAEALIGQEIQSKDDMYKAGEIILNMGPKHVLIKGGHLPGEEVADILLGPDGQHEFLSMRIKTKNIHGTGCTFASAVTAGLAQGASLLDSIACAKEYITGAIAHSIDIGQGSGPTNHFYKSVW